ncbi:hypothetical protein BH09DEP1_BH09DEP1_6310 [soil metagenome]
MKNVSLVFLSLFLTSVSHCDLRQEQNIKLLVQELAQMAPIVQTCILLVKHDMATKEANCARIIDDFNDLLNELCRMQDNLHQEKK